MRLCFLQRMRVQTTVPNRFTWTTCTAWWRTARTASSVAALSSCSISARGSARTSARRIPGLFATTAPPRYQAKQEIFSVQLFSSLPLKRSTLFEGRLEVCFPLVIGALMVTDTRPLTHLEMHKKIEESKKKKKNSGEKKF